MKQIKPIVQIGQTWIDNDSRFRDMAPRKLHVVDIRGDSATCWAEHSQRYVRIKLRRFKPTSNGYRLVEQRRKP